MEYYPLLVAISFVVSLVLLIIQISFQYPLFLFLLGSVANEV